MSGSSGDCDWPVISLEKWDLPTGNGRKTPKYEWDKYPAERITVTDKRYSALKRQIRNRMPCAVGKVSSSHEFIRAEDELNSLKISSFSCP